MFKELNLKNLQNKAERQQAFIKETINNHVATGISIKTNMLGLKGSTYVRLYQATKSIEKRRNSYMPKRLIQQNETEVVAAPFVAFSSSIYNEKTKELKGEAAIVVRVARNNKLFSKGYTPVDILPNEKIIHQVCKKAMPTHIMHAPLESYIVFKLDYPAYFNDEEFIEDYSNASCAAVSMVKELYKRSFPELDDVLKISRVDYIPFEGAISLISGQPFKLANYSNSTSLSDLLILSFDLKEFHSFIDDKDDIPEPRLNERAKKIVERFKGRLSSESYKDIYSIVQGVFYPHEASFRLSSLMKIAASIGRSEFGKTEKIEALRVMMHMWFDAYSNKKACYLSGGNKAVIPHLVEYASLMELNLSEDVLVSFAKSYIYDYLANPSLTNQEIRSRLNWSNILDKPDVYLAYNSGDINYQQRDRRESGKRKLTREQLALTCFVLRQKGLSYWNIVRRMSGYDGFSIGNIKRMIELGRTLYESQKEVLHGQIEEYRRSLKASKLPKFAFGSFLSEHMNNVTPKMKYLSHYFEDCFTQFFAT